MKRLITNCLSRQKKDNTMRDHNTLYRSILLYEFSKPLLEGQRSYRKKLHYSGISLNRTGLQDVDSYA